MNISLVSPGLGQWPVMWLLSPLWTPEDTCVCVCVCVDTPPQTVSLIYYIIHIDNIMLVIVMTDCTPLGGMWLVYGLSIIH